MARSHKVESSKSKEERSSVIKNEREGQSSLHNIPAHLVTEDLQREIIVRYMHLFSETEIYIARPHQEPGEIGEVHLQPAPEHPAGA